jgi:autotransporter translocation and assembly factor TamB
MLVASLVLLLAIAAAVLIQTSWGHDRLRDLVVSQSARYLTATLDIGRLGGSLLRGIDLENVRLTRDGQPIISIERLSLGYNIRELIGQGPVLRSIVLDRPRIVASRLPDGRWDLAGLVVRNPSRPREPGGGPSIEIDAIEVRDASVTLRDAVNFGAAHLPTAFTHVNGRVSFRSHPSSGMLDLDVVSFNGASPQLDVTEVSGAVEGTSEGLTFRSLHVVTPRSDFTLDGRIGRQSPARINLKVSAPRFAFQEWRGVLSGLTNIAIESAFEADLDGPLSAMKTGIDLRSNGGDVKGDLVLDTTVPGWHATGTAAVKRLDLARWLNRADRPSDISGDVRLDMDLRLGRRLPVGSFRFDGAHAGYLRYEADDLVATGRLEDERVRIASATATAYGANVRLTSGTIDFDTGLSFRFAGTAAGVDLRQVPAAVPVPHVASSLLLDFDVAGQFIKPFIRGSAAFGESEFLRARIAPGATGTIDTRSTPVRYQGAGELAGVDLNYFGQNLQVGWLMDPRYAGTLSGFFEVDGSGSAPATMTLEATGHRVDARLFGGRLSDADVSLKIADGTLDATFEGTLTDVDPAIAMNDRLYAARLTGRGRGHFVVRDLLVRSPALADYTIDATLAARDSLVRDLEITSGDVEARLTGGALNISRLTAKGPAADIEASGVLALEPGESSRIAYNVTRSDLSRLSAFVGANVNGDAVTSGLATGPLDRLRFQGDGTIARLDVSGADIEEAAVRYDVTVPREAPQQSIGTLEARLAMVRAADRELSAVSGTVSYRAGAVSAKIDGVLQGNINLTLDTDFNVDMNAKQAVVERLRAAVQHTDWILAASSRPQLAWTESGVSVDGLELVDVASGRQRFSVAGNWNDNGGGRLLLTARGVSLDTLGATAAGPAPYGGLLEGTATVTGTRARPVVAADFSVVEGRLRRLTYTRFAGHVDFADGSLQVNVRFDQARDIWLTAEGTVPVSAFNRSREAAPVSLRLRSSQVSLTLLEGLSDSVRDVTGQMSLDVMVLGTSQDPHFDGRVDFTNAAFQVVSSGARYRNGRVALRLSTDRVQVEALHLEDGAGHALEVTGSLGTHELRVGDLQVAVRARDFEALRNEYGRVQLDADLTFSGAFESPKLEGRLTLSGGSVAVDRILDRTLFQPYSTQAAAPVTGLDPIVALNPWQRMGMDVELHIPGTLRMLGDNVQVSPGTPLGLGDINLRVFGDLYLTKGPGQPMYVNGSLDSLIGTYAFQGRRFDLNPVSSVYFRGDLNPELYVTVTRVISGVETRVSIVGPLQQPELRLASTPPLDPSDVLSLIVFNTSTNELSAAQQEQLAVRAGTLAAGFIAAPMVAALERTLGIDTLEIEPGDIRGAPRVTVGNEIAPGLVARFSRQFGEADYDEATLEYYLSRILRVRATFSDAGSLALRTPFRRVERAGIDLLLFFSF